MSMLERDLSDGILRLRMARPPVNALDPSLVAALREAIEHAPDAGARGGPFVDKLLSA